jgi:hypothetical protein
MYSSQQGKDADLVPCCFLEECSILGRKSQALHGKPSQSPAIIRCVPENLSVRENKIKCP